VLEEIVEILHMLGSSLALSPAFLLLMQEMGLIAIIVASIL